MGCDNLAAISDYGHWTTPERFILERPDLCPIFDGVDAGTIDRIEVGGLELVRWVHRRSGSVDSIVWRSIPEACEYYGISSRCISDRIRRGWMRKRYVPEQIEVCAVPGFEFDTSGMPAHMTAVPTDDRDTGSQLVTRRGRQLPIQKRR